jgi:hypothetical protein
VKPRDRRVRHKVSKQKFDPTELGCPPLALGSAFALLAGRRHELEERIREGEDVWPLYLATLQVLVALLGHAAPRGSPPELLTTPPREMAERLGVAPNTLLAHRRRGTIRPALTKGKLIRWKGSERLE